MRQPQAVAQEADLRADRQVRVSVESGRVTIKPLKRGALSLYKRLKRFDPLRHGGEAMSVAAVGAEKW